MTQTTLTAMFKSREEADRAALRLANELSVERSRIRISPEAGATDTEYRQERSYEDRGFFASLRDLFLPEEDRYSYAEGMRRGSFLLTAQIDDAYFDRASAILEEAGAIDLDEQEAQWRQSGWTGYDPAVHGASAGTGAGMGAAMGGTGAGGAAPMTAGTSAGTAGAAGFAEASPRFNAELGNASRTGNENDTLKVVQERLSVRKRDVAGGRVRVRAYMVERPVEEQVTLHQENVQIERHPVDRAATDADLAGFEERTIEARARSEEAVVSKEARVVEEIGLRKEETERTETIRDKVRETKVDVEDDTAANLTGAAGTRATPGAAPGTPPGTAPGGKPRV